MTRDELVADLVRHRTFAEGFGLATWALTQAIHRLDPTPCTWKEDADGNWHTGCNNIYVLEAGTPTENGFKFCHGCGKPLVEVPYVESTNEEE